jgi:hypothetical protein
MKGMFGVEEGNISVGGIFDSSSSCHLGHVACCGLMPSLQWFSQTSLPPWLL